MLRREVLGGLRAAPPNATLINGHSRTCLGGSAARSRTAQRDPDQWTQVFGGAQDRLNDAAPPNATLINGHKEFMGVLDAELGAAPPNATLINGHTK